MTESRTLLVTFSDGSQLELDWLTDGGETVLASASRRASASEEWSPPEQVDID